MRAAPVGGQVQAHPVDQPDHQPGLPETGASGQVATAHTVRLQAMHGCAPEGQADGHLPGGRAVHSQCVVLLGISEGGC